MKKYSPRQKTLTVNGKKIKQGKNESRSMYWERIKSLQQEQPYIAGTDGCECNHVYEDEEADVG